MNADLKFKSGVCVWNMTGVSAVLRIVTTVAVMTGDSSCEVC